MRKDGCSPRPPGWTFVDPRPGSTPSRPWCRPMRPLVSGSRRSFRASSTKPSANSGLRRLERGAPGAGGLQEDDPVAGGEESIAHLSQRSDLLGLREHDPSHFSGVFGRVSDPRKSVLIAGVVVLTWNSQALSQIVRAHVQNVDVLLAANRAQIVERSRGFDLDRDQGLGVCLPDKLRERPGAVFVRPDSGEAALPLGRALDPFNRGTHRLNPVRAGKKNSSGSVIKTASGLER